jgi:hypothetical protein
MATLANAVARNEDGRNTCVLLNVTVVLKNVKAKRSQTSRVELVLGDQAVAWVETQHRAPAGWLAEFSTQPPCPDYLFNDSKNFAA